MRVWITPPSRQEHLTPPRSSWDPGRNPVSPSSEEVLELPCMRLSVFPFKFQLCQMRVWITPPSRQEHLTPPRSSWDPGRNPGSPSSEEVLQLSCMRLHSSDHIFIIKLRGVRRNDYVSEGTKHVVKSKPCLLVEEPVIFKLWSETKPGQDKILSTKLLPPDLLPKLRPTAPLQNYVPFWQTFFQNMMILNLSWKVHSLGWVWQQLC